MSLRAFLYADWVELLSVTQLRRWRRWRPFWSRARGRTQRRERGAPPGRHGSSARYRRLHGRDRTGETGHSGEGQSHPPREGRGGQAQGQIPQPGPEAWRLGFPHEEAAERAKILRFWRLQHGQGQDEEQAAAKCRA